jgi:hypothetical protein
MRCGACQSRTKTFAFHPGSIDHLGLMSTTRCVMCLAFVALILAFTMESAATNPMVVFPPRPERLRATRIANANGKACLAELGVRKIPFVKGPKVPTIDTPVRLTGPLHEVVFEMFHPTARTEKPGPVLDCRLLVALDDLAIFAHDLGIARVRYNSIHRGRWARQKGARHAAGVAIDVVELVKKDGSVLNVKQDFEGHGIGQRTCGEGAPEPKGAPAIELRRFVCTLDSERLFNLILTPHYDRNHQDHFHLEVRRGIKWFLTQ